MRRVFRCLIGLVLAGLPFLTRAQPAETDPDPTRWINYQQAYLKLLIAENGIYQLTVDELRQAGVPVQQINPTTLQLFHRGVEQALYVAGEADGRLDGTDFLQFYGQRNDGTPDSLLYRPFSAQPHRYYSLFSDTSAYFLTWSLTQSPGAGKRMTAYQDTTFAHLLPERYHWAEELRLFTDTYPGWAAGLPQKIEYSFYEAGEGYTGPIQHKDKPVGIAFQLSNPVADGPPPQLEVLLVGRDLTHHRVEVSVGPALARQSLLDSVRFLGYSNARIRHVFNWPAAGPNSAEPLMVSTVSRGEAGSTDDYSVSYIGIRYPQQLTLSSQLQTLLRLVPNPAGRSLLNLTNAAPNTICWDISNPAAPVRVGTTALSATHIRLIVRNTQQERLLICTSQPRRVPSIQPVTFIDRRNRKPTFLIVSHGSLMEPATPSTVNDRPNAVQAYARYRASTAGGGYDTLTVTMQHLFDQYSYGERHPLAIRRFARQMLQQSSGTVPYLLLIGRGRSTPGIRNDPQQAQLDLVMTAGFPGSDGMFTTGLLATEPDVPALPTGRINAGSPQEVLNYLNKVKEYEQPAGAGLWRKNLLHLSGGQSADERALFRRLVTAYQQQITSPFLGGQVTTYTKRTDSPVEALPLAKPVNEGAGLITFFGHSGLDATDLDIGFCSNDVLGYRNTGKYPLLLVNGCAIGNFFFGRPTLTTDWVLTPNRGAIAAIAQSHLGYTDVMHTYTSHFYRLLADSSQLHKSIGQLQQETIRRVLSSSADGRTLANTQQMVLQGDPALHPFPFRLPDYQITSGGLSIEDGVQGPLTTLSDSVRIRAVIQNAGQYRPGQLAVRVRRFVNGQVSGVYNLIIPRSTAYQDTVSLTLPNDRQATGPNQFEVTHNPTESPLTQPEINYANNLATTELTIPSQQPVLIYPPLNGVVNTTTIRLVAQYVSTGTQAFDLELDSTALFSSPFRQNQRLTGSSNISYLAKIPNRPRATYYWRVRRINDGGPPENWITSSFVYAPDSLFMYLPEGQLQLAGSVPTDNQQGDLVDIPVEFTNLSPYPFADSVLVRQTIYATGLSNPQTTQWLVKAPTGTDTLRFTTRLATEKLPGLNRLVLTANPHVQPESSFLNNTLNLPLFVQPDTFGPLLEVAIDGARITDDAFVSARPLIEVLVADENRSLIRHDTTGLDLYLQRPGKNAPFERLNWQRAVIQPTGADRAFRIRYPASLLTEGIYQLLVTAQDALGNRATPYQVRFQVVDERTFSNLQVYPNPFTSHTLFAFGLTGPQPPDSLIITITDLNGQVMRHLHPSVRIGRNEWSWDGRSDTGALLPAGTYVYTLTINATWQWPVANDLGSQVSGRIILLR